MGASEASGALIFDITGITEHSNEITVDKLSNRIAISGISRKQRNITLDIRITAADVEAERKLLRKVFAEGRIVTLEFETDKVTCAINGCVESCNNPMFAKEPTMSVTIICPESNFMGEVIETSFSGVGVTIDDPGDEPSGCTIWSVVGGSISSGTVTISNLSNGTSMTISVEKIIPITGPTQAGDIITMNSGLRKSCILTRGGVDYNIFSAILIPYAWLLVTPGENDISIGGLGATVTLEYQPAYGGL